MRFQTPPYRQKPAIGWGTQFQIPSSFLATIYTIGHSTRTLDELVAALLGQGIKTVVDIRSFPMSRRLPHFNREWLEQELLKHGIEYVWMKDLGGRRKKVLQESPNTGLRNDSFRNYADYMMTGEFASAIAKLVEISGESGDANQSSVARKGSFDSARPKEGLTALRMTREESDGGGVAIMCAERVYFQCHRMLVSDYLTAQGHTVLHIDDEKRAPRKHTMMAEARLVDGKLIYDGGRLL